MIFFTYINKFNTIIYKSSLNTSLNPISELSYGGEGSVTRALVYFDHSDVKRLVDNGIMQDTSKMKHILHITNAGSLDLTQIHDCGSSIVNQDKKIRAASFDLIFFLIPKEWDRGKGFNYTKNHLNTSYYSMTPIDPKRLISDQGCNWFQRMNGLKWENEGIYSNEFLSLEYDKWACGEESIVIGRQHFDYGNENISLDITDTFNKFLSGEIENHGIGIAFSPMLESSSIENENYCTLFTDKTNTFFAPFVETRYDDVISDDRSNFVLGKKNKLYLYCTIGDTLEDLDKNPTVTIKNGDDEIISDSEGNKIEGIEAKKFSKGIYYIELGLSRSDFEVGTMLYDTWDGIVYQGSNLDAVELDFVIKDSINFFNIGKYISTSDAAFSLSISGISEKEQVYRGDIRKLVINARPKYVTNTFQLIDNMDIRLYVKDGTREVDVITWDSVNKAFSENFYVIDTNILLPQRYFVDIRVKYGMSSIIHHDVLSFDIVNLINNKYA